MSPRSHHSAVWSAAIAALALFAGCEAPAGVVARRSPGYTAQAKQPQATEPRPGPAQGAGAAVPPGAVTQMETAASAGEGAWDAERLMGHIRQLSSDEFEGRGPATRGEELTVAYLERQFRELGLEPGNPDGTYFQNVPLVGFLGSPQAQFQVGNLPLPLEFPRDYVALSRKMVPETQVLDSELVFVGYGVVAPEYNWDDFKDVDVRGKTVVMLINDPAVMDASDPTRFDDSAFRGRAMTYYGRWTYKYEIASQKGAKAVLIIHDEQPAGYPYEVVEGSWSRENFDIVDAQAIASRVEVEGWLRNDIADKLFKACGQDLSQLQQAAKQRDFRPVPLKARFDCKIANRLRQVQSKNMVAKITGQGPRSDEFVVYTAHWDHLGRDEKVTQGDGIYNGALDNASGVGGLLEIARAFASKAHRPPRSVLFLATTAEEKGLLGSKYYATHPLVPLERTLADINMDGLNAWGPTKDLIVIGMGQTTLEDSLADIARQMGRELRPDSEPEKGFFYRSDHFEFAKRGVPAIHFDSGDDYLGQSPEYGRERKQAYTTNDYHKPSDEVRDDWDLSGAIQDLRMLFRLGLHVASDAGWPQWKPGSEFESVRLQMLGERN